MKDYQKNRLRGEDMKKDWNLERELPTKIFIGASHDFFNTIEMFLYIYMYLIKCFCLTHI